MFRRAECPIARHAMAGADRVRIGWGRAIVAGGIGAPPDAGRAYKADGSIVPMRGDRYTVQASKIKALSKEARAWFKATLRNVRESDARIRSRETVKTLAELCPAVADREKRLRQWATGGRKAAGESAPYNPAGATACCPAGGDAFRYEAHGEGKDRALMHRVIACGCLVARNPVGHACSAESADRAA